MNTKKPGTTLKLLLLSTSLLAVSGCVTIPVTTYCSVAGTLSAGGICSDTKGHTSDLNFDQYIEFLEPQPERPDPNNPGQKLPARAGAICQSSEDFNKIKTVLEEACREMGSRCLYDMKQMIKALEVK